MPGGDVDVELPGCDRVRHPWIVVQKEVLLHEAVKHTWVVQG